MNRDIELDVWRGQWHTQSDAPAAADLRDRVARETRRMKVGLIAPILVTVAIGGPVAERAVTSPQLETVVLAIEVWLFILVTWAGSLWIGSGTWRPLGETTAAFVDLSVRRCQSNLRAVRFGAVLYVAQLLFVLIWQFHFSSIGLGALLASWPVILLGWLGAPAAIGFLVWHMRRKRSELAYLLDVQRQLADERT